MTLLSVCCRADKKPSGPHHVMKAPLCFACVFQTPAHSPSRSGLLMSRRHAIAPDPLIDTDLINDILLC